MRLHRTLPLAAAVLLAACQAGDATAPTLAPADARMNGVNMFGGGRTDTSTTSSTTETTTTQSTDSTSITGRGSHMGGSGG